MGEIKEVHEIKEGDRFADERSARRKEAISFANKFLIEPTRALENKFPPDIYSTFCRLARVFVNAIANNGLNNENDIRFSMQEHLKESEKERVLEETRNLLKILSDRLGINNVIENLEISKLNENESRNKKENKYSIVFAYKIICDELLNTQETKQVSDNQNIIDMMNMILSNLDGVQENLKFSATDKKKEPEVSEIEFAESKRAEKELSENQELESPKKQAPVLTLEFKDYAELDSKLRGIDKSKVKKLTLKCTGSKICENINLEGFENLQKLCIDNCSVILSKKGLDGEEKQYCEKLSLLDIRNSCINSQEQINIDCMTCETRFVNTNLDISDKEFQAEILKTCTNASNLSIKVKEIDKEFIKFDKSSSDNLPKLTIDNFSQLQHKDLMYFHSIFGKNLFIDVKPRVNNHSQLGQKESDNKRNYEQYRDSINLLNKIINGIDNVNDERTNELEVFLKIYRALGGYFEYSQDDIANSKSGRKESVERREYIVKNSRFDSILNGEGICAGFSELLRNALKLKGIDCITIVAGNEKRKPSHAFNQVKIGDKYYFVDLTWDEKRISVGEDMEYCLLSREDIEKFHDHILLSEEEWKKFEDLKIEGYKVYDSFETFNQDVIRKYVKEFEEKDKKIGGNVISNFQHYFNSTSKQSRKRDIEIDFEELRKNFEDKNSNNFEIQMFTILQALGRIPQDVNIRNLELKIMNYRNRISMINDVTENVRNTGVQKDILKNMYRVVGLKTSDLELLQKQNIKEPNLQEKETNEEVK